MDKEEFSKIKKENEKQKHVTCAGSVAGGIYCKCTNPKCGFTAMYCFRDEMISPEEDGIKRNTKICYNCSTKVYMEEGVLECPNCKLSNKIVGEGDKCQQCKEGFLYEIDPAELKVAKSIPAEKPQKGSFLRKLYNLCCQTKR